MVFRDVPQLTVWHHTDSNVSIVTVWCVIFYIVWGATLTTYELCCCPQLTRCTDSGVNRPHVYSPTVCSTFVQCFRCGPAVYDVHIISFLGCGALFKWMIVTVLTVAWAIPYFQTPYVVLRAVSTAHVFVQLVITLCLCFLFSTPVAAVTRLWISNLRVYSNRVVFSSCSFREFPGV